MTLDEISTAARLAEHGRRDQRAGARARGPQPRHAAGGAALRPHPARAALPADPLRHPVRRRRDLAAARSAALVRPAARARPGRACGPCRARTVRVTMECAGNGRARLRAATGQPAVAGRGGRHGGVDRRAAAARARAGPGSSPTAVEVVFTGADHGVERGVEQDYQRSLTVAEALGDDVLLAYAMNGAASRRSTAIRCGWWCPAGTAWRT